MAVEVDAWLRSSDEFLGVARTFIRTTGNSAFLRGVRGEILTLRQLLRTYRDTLMRPSARLDYRGSSKKEYDLFLAVDGQEILVDAKEKSEGDHWVRARGRDYAIIKTNRKTGFQDVKTRTDFRDGFYFVFVDSVGFPDTGEAVFYTLSDREAKVTLSKLYKDMRAARGNARRPRNPDSDDFWIFPKDLERFRDDQLLRIGKSLR